MSDEKFAAMYAAYVAFNCTDPEGLKDFLGIDQAPAEAVYRQVLSLYTGGEESAAHAGDKIMTAGALRFLYVLIALNLGKPELKENRIRHTIERLEKLLDRVTDLRI